jgi:cytochrome c-type biogenesis protein CcsB
MRIALIILAVYLAGGMALPQEERPAGSGAEERAAVDRTVTKRTPPDTSALGRVVVMYNGRMKPLATHAREAVRRLFGEDHPAGFEALSTYASILLEPQAWLSTPCLAVGRELGMEVFNDPEALVSPNDVNAAHSRLVSIIQRARGMSGMGEGMQSSHMMKALGDQAMQLLHAASTLQDLAFDFHFLPDPAETGPEWLSLSDLRAGNTPGAELPSARQALAAFDAIKKAYLEGDGPGFDAATADLIALQRRDSDRVLSKGMVTLENLYYIADVKKVGMILFALSAFFYLLTLFKNNALLQRLAFLGFAAGILWNFWILGGRTAIGGRLPLKNLNEVYLVVVFSVPLIGLLLDRLFREPLYSGISAGLTLIGFIGSLFLPAQGYDVTPLMAILISPWREVHILTIMLSYAVMLVAAGLHLGFLLVLLIQPNARSVEDGKVVYSALAGDLDRKAYLMVAWGFLLLTIGIATGAAWAHSSWGRYWGWDPKEVWATIAWAIYALFLHLRLFFKTRSELLAIISLIGFAAILFTYFGVTYLLSGLHAYA